MNFLIRFLADRAMALPAWLTYSIALAVPAGTVLLYLAIAPVSNEAPAMIVFLVPITLSAYLGGLGAGAVSTLFMAVVSAYFLLPPVGSFGLEGTLNLVRWVTLVLGGLVVSVLIESLRKSFRCLQQRERELEALVEERTAELRRHERDMRAILDNIPSLVAYWDSKLHNRFANRAYLAWFGFDPDRMAGAHIRDVLGAERYEFNLPYIEKALAGVRQQFEKALPASDGRGVCHTLADYVPDIQDGEVRGFYALITDISVVKAAELALRDSEEKFRLLVTSAREGIWQVDIENRIIYANDALAHLLGYESGDMLVGLPIHHFMFVEDVAGYCWQMKAWQDDRQCLHEQRLKRRDGSESWCLLSISPLEDSQGNMLGSFILVTDYNERRQTEEAFKALNRDFVALLENTSDFIYFKDQDSRFRFCSQTLARITGHRDWRDMIGKHDLEVFPKDVAQIYYEEEIPVFRQGKPLLDRVDPYYDEDGMPGWVSTNKWPVFGDDGKSVVGIFGISRIVTERVRVEAQLRAANRELQGFTYAASHDLKAPLGRINSFSALLERNYKTRLDGEGLLFLDLIRRNTLRMMALIEDLLAHAQIEQLSMDPESVCLRSAFLAALNEKDEEIRQSRAVVRMELADLRVWANPMGVSQVLRNLLENALKYAAGGNPPLVEIGGQVSEDRCRVWIRDNGVGFNMAYHDQIFEIFRRLHTYEEFPGSGVGLALVRKAMERMGGKVWAESAPNEGATFYLEFARWKDPFLTCGEDVLVAG